MGKQANGLSYIMDPGRSSGNDLHGPYWVIFRIQSWLMRR